jgi:hypothetical protein
VAKLFLGLVRPTIQTPPVGAPGTPTNLSLMQAGDTDVSVAWDRADDTDTSMVIERALDSGGSPGTYVAQTLEQHANVFADWSCDPATTYWYRVKATNSAGSSSYSSAASVTTSAFGGSATPTITSVTANADSPFQITLSWTNPADQAGGSKIYLIERSTDGAFYVPVKVKSCGAVAAAETYVDTPLTPSTSYAYRMRKVNNTTYGPYTYSNTETTAAIGTHPNVPTSLSAVTTSATSTTLSWTDTNSGTATYLVEKATIPGAGVPSAATFSQVTETAAGATSYALVTVANTPLYVRVRASNVANQSAYSTIIVVRPASTGTGGTIYEIGPGKPYTAIGDLDHAALGPGDTVKIYYATYAEKWSITRRGTAANPIHYLGIPDGSGNLPIVTGQSATTDNQFVIGTILEDASLIHVGKLSADPTGHNAGHFILEGLDIRFGHHENSPNTYTRAAGGSGTYGGGSSGIYCARGDNFTIKGCDIHDNSNGIFGAADGTTTRVLHDVTIEGNYFYGNGTVGGFLEHHSYLEGQRTTYQYNHFGPQRSGAFGSALKDRSSALVVRYNFIEGGIARMDLVEAQNSLVDTFVDPAYRKTHFYGNVISSDSASQSSFPFHYGGDSGAHWEYSHGICYFAYNTFVLRFNQSEQFRLILFRMKQDAGTVAGVFDVRNNVVVVKPDSGATPESYPIDKNGRVWFGKNWVSPYTAAVRVAAGTGIVTGTANLLSAVGNNPLLASITTGDYRPTGSSPFINQTATALPGSFPTGVIRQYVMHQDSEARATTNDLGYYET